MTSHGSIFLTGGISRALVLSLAFIAENNNNLPLALRPCGKKFELGL